MTTLRIGPHLTDKETEARMIHLPEFLSGGSDGKESTCDVGDPAMFDSWLRKIPWRRERLPTPVSSPGELHGQRSLAGYSPWGRQESDTTEQLTQGSGWKSHG